MNKKLTAKIQKITPQTKSVGAASVFSNVLIIHPEDEALQKKKGVIYAVFDITSPVELEPPIITNLTHDVLQNSYYQSDNISPIQSLEKAVVDVKNKLTNLNSTNGKATKINIEFNIVAGVLWGNVLYIVQHGKGQSYITREENTKPISVVTESNFSAASGVVKNEDVIVFATQAFADEYLPKKLFEATNQNFGALAPNASCLMLKFIIEASFSDEDYIDFGIPNKKGAKLNAIVGTLKNMFKNKKRAPAPHEQMDTVNTVAPVRVRRRTTLQTPTEKKAAIVSKVIIPIVAVLLLVSIGVSIKSRRGTTKQAESSDQITTLQESPEEGKEEGSAESEEPEEGVEKTDAETFYDVKITNEAATPTDIAILDGTVIATDQTAGTIYTSGTETPKFVAGKDSFVGIRNVIPNEDLLTFTDNEGYKVYDLTNNALTESYALENPKVATAYLDFFYEITDDVLTKYTKAETELAGSVWAQSADFKGAKGMTIAISIYILKADGTIAKYTSGTKDTFEIKGWDNTFKNPIQITTRLDWDNIYIADQGDQSIVVISKDGDFVKRIKHAKKDMWTNIKGIAVTPAEDKAYVLSGSKIYEVSL